MFLSDNEIDNALASVRANMDKSERDFDKLRAERGILPALLDKGADVVTCGEVIDGLEKLRGTGNNPLFFLTWLAGNFDALRVYARTFHDPAVKAVVEKGGTGTPTPADIGAMSGKTGQA